MATMEFQKLLWDLNLEEKSCKDENTILIDEIKKNHWKKNFLSSKSTFV